MADQPNNPTGTVEQQDDSGIQEFTITARRLVPSPDTFIANVNAPKRQSLARSSRFNVEIQLPYKISDVFKAYGHDAESLQFFCEAAEFPGRSLDVTDFRIYGPSFKMPTKTTFNEITMTFLCDAHMTQKVLFDDWMDYINPTYRGFDTGESYDMEYRDNYVSSIYIKQYNELYDVGLESNRLTYMAELVEAYPISVTALQTNWADDNFHRVQVTFSFYEWKGLGQTAVEVPYPNGLGYDPRSRAKDLQLQKNLDLFLRNNIQYPDLNYNSLPGPVLDQTLYRTIPISTLYGEIPVEVPLQYEPDRRRGIFRRRRFK